MAPLPKSPQKAPYVVDESAGKKVWCSCGNSKRQPYCDGSHAGTEFLPKIIHLDAAKTVAWCGCKRTANPPYCDGAHNKL